MWKLKELKRFNQVLLQISSQKTPEDEIEIRGTITTWEDEEEVRIKWMEAIEMMNREVS